MESIGELGFFPPLHWDLSQTRDLFAGHMTIEDPRAEEGSQGQQQSRQTRRRHSSSLRADSKGLIVGANRPRQRIHQWPRFGRCGMSSIVLAFGNISLMPSVRFGFHGEAGKAHAPTDSASPIRTVTCTILIRNSDSRVPGSGGSEASQCPDHVSSPAKNHTIVT